MEPIIIWKTFHYSSLNIPCLEGSSVLWVVEFASRINTWEHHFYIRPQLRLLHTPAPKLLCNVLHTDDFCSAAVRVRPPLKPTDPGFELIPQRFQKGMVHVTSPTSIAVDSPQGRKIFVFDRVFSPDTTQDGVWEYLEESVSAFLQGFNVSLLAYGQSGAGKSFTMGTSGPGEQESNKVMGESAKNIALP